MPRLLLISVDGLAGFYWRDPRARMPTLRALAARGAVSAGMRAVFPTTTWPTHVSLVTGVSPRRHGVVGNHVLNRLTGAVEDLTGDPVHDAPGLLRAPTLHDVAHAAGRRTAAVDWPATRHARTLGFNLPFFKDQGVFERETDPTVWAELGAAGFPLDRQGEWALLPKRHLKDAMVADVAVHVLRHHAPDLLLVHFLCTDSLQHLHGPRSPEAYWAIAYVDGLIGRVLGAVGERALERDAAVMVVSDHGFLPSDHGIRGNVWLRRQGLLDVEDAGRIVGGRARLVMNHGAAYVYLSDAPGGADRGRDGLAAELAHDLARLPGVAGAWPAAAYADLGLPTPAENPHAGDLILEAATGYAFVDDADGDAVLGPPRYHGTHGQRPGHPENLALFLAAGAGVRRGVTLGAIESRDVAPTAARLLGLDLGAVEGRCLEEALA